MSLPTSDHIKNELKDLMPKPPALYGWIALAVVLVGVYWNEMLQIVLIWWREPDYGHCFLVPVFSIALLWRRRELFDPAACKGSLWGIPFLVLWAAMWWFSAYFSYQKTIPLSIVPFLAGATLIVGGWHAMRWAWQSIVFLIFMVPIPDVMSGWLRLPLQRVGTVVSVYIIQTLGIPAVSRQNVILLESGPLGVEEACSGLRMLMLFMAVCVGAAFWLRRPLWERIVIVVSAAPIAITANIIRITVTAILHHLEWGELADKVFHDMAGLLMMPIAMLLLWAEMAILSKLFIEPAEQPLSLSGSLTPAGGATTPQRPIDPVPPPDDLGGN